MAISLKNNYVKVNSYTRPGRKNSGIKGVVWHYTASPSAPAINIRNYFNGTCITEKRYASAHIAVDDKEAIVMVPFNEVAYHAHDNNRCYPDLLKPNANFTAIGVEMCVDKNMKLTEKTFQNAVEVGVILCKQFKLDPMKHFFRHYDVTHKNCPAMWVSNPSEFKRFKEAVKKKMGSSSPSPSNPKITGDTYVVKKGDTMYSISQASGVPVATLKKLNPNVKPEAMKIGQVLKLKAPAPSKPNTYVVRKGDTLYSIAKKYGMTVAEIQKLNPNVKATALKIGQKLNLSGAVTHTIKKGDTLYALAVKYGTTVAQLQKLNPKVKPNALQVGYKLIVKAGGK